MTMDGQTTISEAIDSLVGSRDGSTFDPERDTKRLNKQHVRVWLVMKDEQWHTLAGISAMTGDPEGSVSARLRDFRKPRFGSHTVQRRTVKDSPGLHVYRLVWNRTGGYPYPTKTQINEAYGSDS